MASATSKLDILITARNQSSGAINAVKNDLTSLDAAAGKLGGGLSGLLGVAGVAGFGALAAGIGGAVVEMARGAAETERLAQGFNTLATQAGESSDAMLASMRDAAQGTISDSQLMLDANTAMLLGVTHNSEQMGQLMEVAAARGHAMGESTAQAFGDIVEGIGRGSKLILDNLGIVLDLQKVYGDYAQSIGTVSQNLTEAQQKQALLNAVIQSSTGIVQANKDAGGDAADNFERMDAAITNAKDALGGLFAPAVAAIAQSIADATNKAVEGMKEMAKTDSHLDVALNPDKLQVELLKEQIDGLKTSMKELAASGQVGSAAYRDQAAQVASLTAKMTGLDTALKIESGNAGAADEATRGLTASMGASSAAQAGMQAALYATNRALAETKLMANLAQEAFDALRASETTGSDAIAQAAAGAGTIFAAHLGADAGLGKQKEVTAELTRQREVWRDMGYTEKDITNVLLPAYIQNLNDADQATFKVATGTAKISDEAKAASQAFDDLKSKVSSVLQGALDPGVGVDPASLLPRPDAINEDARRLADVAVNGWASPWADYFRTEFPDLFRNMVNSGDIKTGAAELLQDFQDGLEPELLDKGKVKERVRRMILGEQNMADLAQEIASELSTEMGVPLQQALAAAQGTVGGGTGMGNQVATQFSDGASAALDDTGGGGNFVNKFIDQAKAQYPLLSTAGKDAGKLWGAGFLETVGANVPPALIKILTDLVTPGVMASLAQKATLTGATP